MRELGWHAAPAYTWLCCRQCRQFYTREALCACRKDDSSENKTFFWWRVLQVGRKVVRAFLGFSRT
jgi:hypothetical protein